MGVVGGGGGGGGEEGNFLVPPFPGGGERRRRPPFPGKRWGPDPGVGVAVGRGGGRGRRRPGGRRAAGGDGRKWNMHFSTWPFGELGFWWGRGRQGRHLGCPIPPFSSLRLL